MSENTANEIDKFHGQGGSYDRNPKTGERELLERTKSLEEHVAEGEPPPDSLTNQPAE